MFTTGNTILTDDLPNSITYGSATVTPSAGSPGRSSVPSGTDDLSCTAGGPVSIASGGSFTVAFSATPSAVGTYTNPRASGNCVVPQSGNTCSDTVVVGRRHHIPIVSPRLIPGG